MHTARILAIALVLGAATTLPAAADPISDPSAVSSSNTGGFEAALFDSGGLPFMLTSGPTYFPLPPHRKLRGGDGSEEDASGPVINAFLSSFPFGPSGSGSDHGDGGSAGAGGTGGGAGDLSETPFGDLPGGDPLLDPHGDDVSIDEPGGDGARRVPEPSLLLLLAPAGAMLLRRHGLI